MDCKFIWWNLPKKIKEKIGIDLLYNWNRLPIEVNTFLRQFEDEDNSTYSQFFTPKYKTNWFKLISDLDKICQAFSEEPSEEVESKVFYRQVEECIVSDPITLYIVRDEEGAPTYYTNENLTELADSNNIGLVYEFLSVGVIFSVIFTMGMYDEVEQQTCR
jgi:hypothetical protein